MQDDSRFAQYTHNFTDASLAGRGGKIGTPPLYRPKNTGVRVTGQCVGRLV
jgi:hypothetical protein